MNIVSANAQAAAQAAARAFAEAARQAVSARGAFHVALSGGSTPRLMYQELRIMSDLPWPQVHVYFSDERSVGPDDPDSNYRLAQQELLRAVPVPDGQIHRLRGETQPIQEAAREYAACLPKQLDLVLLGLGEDGHTASLFPGTSGLHALGRVVANHVPRLTTWRLTFTFPEINAARQRWLLVTGQNKAAVVAQVQAGQGDYPVSRVLHPTWFLDQAAASQLKK